MARSPRHLLIAAGGCAVAFVVLLAAIYLWGRLRWLDATAMAGFIDVQRSWVGEVTYRLSHLGDPEAVGLIALALAAIALARGRPRVALAVLFLVAATSVSSQLLKALIDYPRYEAVLSVAEVKRAAFPSGHSTAAMTLAFCGVLVAPARARPLAVVAGLGLALAVAYSVVSLGGHFPSDAAGGFLLATGWTLAVVAALQAAAQRWPERTLRSGLRTTLARTTDRVAEAGLVAAVAMATLVGGLLSVTVVLFRLSDVVEFAAERSTAVAVAGALAACAVLLLAGVTAALSRRV